MKIKCMRIVKIGLVFGLLFLPTVLFAAENEPVCTQCHAGQPGHLGEPVGLWQTSVHHENGISCHDCHGGDPTDFAMAMSPERGFIGVPEKQDIPAFCGRCHVGIKEDYMKSAHGQALGSGGPQCVTCHNSHAIVRASLDLINPESCSRCHEYGRAAEIRGALEATDNRIADLESELKSLHNDGFSTDEMEGALFSLRNDYHRIFHSVDVDQVVSQTKSFQERLDEISARAQSNQDDLGQRKIFGGIVIVLLIVGGVLLLMLKRTFEEEE